MPFTGSHPAAVLPLMRWGLVPSALVIGSMAPDLPYYLPLPVNSGLTHSVAGVVGIDLVFGVISFALWQLLLVPVAVGLAPTGVRQRLAPELPVPWRQHVAGPRPIALLVLSLVIGAATHVLWDEFTHDGRWGYQHLSWLAGLHGPLAGYRWAQYASGVIGAALLLLAARRWWTSTPPADPLLQRIPALGRRTALAVWTAIALAAASGLVSGLAAALLHGEGIRRGLFLAATWGGGAALLTALVCAGICARRAGVLVWAAEIDPDQH